jgi:hypothetical protein
MFHPPPVTRGEKILTAQAAQAIAQNILSVYDKA